MPVHFPGATHLWHLITRLGEAQILVPGALLAALALLRRRDARPMAICWIASLSVAALITAASKVAFIGWGIGWAEFDFTGISGHAMLAAAVYPPLLAALTCGAPMVHRFAVAGGLAVALLIGVSRVVLGAHSVSEVLAGWLVGGTVSVATLTRANLTPMQIGAAIPAVLALWLAFMSVQAPASKTHEMVTRLALTLSGHKRPYTRSAMLHDLRRRQGAPAGAPSVTPPNAK